MSTKTGHRVWIRRGAALSALAIAASVGWSAASQQAHLIASNPSPVARLGISVAISGDTLIAGADLADIGGNADQGAAYVFVRSGTSWSEEAILTATGGAAGDNFGVGVAIEGDTAVVGALLDDVGANADQGSAYVFVRSGTAWTQQAQLTATNGAASDILGSNVVISGNTVIVAALLDDVGSNVDQGSAYVFTRSGTTWTEEAQLTSSSGLANDHIGWGVSLFGNTALVGAPGRDVGASTDQGSAFIFTRSGTTWTERTEFTATEGAAGDAFGTHVSLFGDTALVGARFADVGVNVDQGAAWVFTGSGASWSQQAMLTAFDGAPNDRFGWTTALFGDTALLSAYHADVGGNTDQGAAYLFARSGTSWAFSEKLTGSGGASGDEFGYFVGLSWDTAVVGADLDDGGSTDQGSVYVFVSIPHSPVDTDRDGLPNGYEFAFLINSATRDTDADGVEDGVEVGVGRDPVVADGAEADADNDGVPDSLDDDDASADGDLDGIKDAFEIAYNRSNDLTGRPPFGDADLLGGRPNLADAQLLTRITLGLTGQGAALDQNLDINRNGTVQRSDATLLTYFAQNRIPYIHYP